VQGERENQLTKKTKGIGTCGDLYRGEMQSGASYLGRGLARRLEKNRTPTRIVREQEKKKYSSIGTKCGKTSRGDSKLKLSLIYTELISNFPQEEEI